MVKIVWGGCDGWDGRTSEERTYNRKKTCGAVELLERYGWDRLVPSK